MLVGGGLASRKKQKKLIDDVRSGSDFETKPAARHSLASRYSAW